MQPKYAQICKNMQIKYAKICKKYAKIYKSMFLHMVHLYALPTLLMIGRRTKFAAPLARRGRHSDGESLGHGPGRRMPLAGASDSRAA